jgi:serine protease Do
MRSLYLRIAAIVLAAWPTVVMAENLKLSGNKHWLTVASTKDVQAAIGIARHYAGFEGRVVSSKSGYFAVVLGPYAGQTVAAARDKNGNFPDVPKDALLSDGSRYIDTVWTIPAQNPVMTEYRADKPLQLSSGDLTVEFKLEKMGEDQFSTVLSGAEKLGTAFSFTVAKEGDYSPVPAEAALIQLAANSKTPQIVFTRYTGGAHCCTNTWIVQKLEGAKGWSLVDAGKLDGGGFWFEDIDGEGGLDLLSVDNSFLYAFDSYAGSFAPLKISQLRDGKIVDAIELGGDASSPTRDRLKQDLAGLEFQAKLNPDLWKSNGYLAAWVASKIRLGQGEDAWQTVVQNIDRKSDFGPQECTTGQTIADCPAENLKTVPVLKALAAFLKEDGYEPLPEAAELLLQKGE